MEAKFYRAVLVLFSLAATMMQVAEAFIPRISRSLGTSSINYNIGVKRNGRSLPSGESRVIFTTFCTNKRMDVPPGLGRLGIIFKLRLVCGHCVVL